MESVNSLNTMTFKEVISNDISNNSSIFKLILKSSPDSILFELYDKNISVGIRYQIILNIQKLEELNPYFKQFQSIEKIIKNFKRLIESNQLNIEQNNSELKLFFVNQVNEDEKIYIKLNQINEDEHSIINKLIQIIKDLKEENTNIKKEIKEIKELKEQKIQSLIDDNTSLKEKLNEILKEINTLKNEVIITSNLDKESSIIKKKEDINLLNSWISPLILRKNIKFKKLYRATEDGDKASDFHRLCDDKGPTLTIGKTKKGYIFGGFTLEEWDSKENYSLDGNSFVFSLNKKKMFRFMGDIYSTSCNKNSGPTFGANDNAIAIHDNCLSNTENYCGKKTSYGNNLGLTEDARFSLDEIEVLLIENN